VPVLSLDMNLLLFQLAKDIKGFERDDEALSEHYCEDRLWRYVNLALEVDVDDESAHSTST
jgi:hypothetical protein